MCWILFIFVIVVEIMLKYKKDFIDFMLECGVLTFGDFITKSGRKTPYFINTGNYKTGSQISKLGEFYSKAIMEEYLNKKDNRIDVLFGPAYKGIPLVVTIAISLNNNYSLDVPFSFNRKEVKDHGEKGFFVGHKFKDNDNVMIIEDVTTAGTSIYETVPLLKKESNVNISGLLISVDRMEKGKTGIPALQELNREFEMQTFSIVNIKEIVSYLYNQKVNGKVWIDDEIMGRIDKYWSNWL